MHHNEPLEPRTKIKKRTVVFNFGEDHLEIIVHRLSKSGRHMSMMPTSYSVPPKAGIDVSILGLFRVEEHPDRATSFCKACRTTQSHHFENHSDELCVACDEIDRDVRESDAHEEEARSP